MPNKMPREEPQLGSWKLSKTPVLAVLLYCLLAVAAAGALLANTRADLVPPAVRLGAPIAFGAFLLLFAAYRFALVRARRYPAGKAFFQVGASALFLMLLVPGAARELRPPQLRPVEALLVDPDPSVRALACEVAPHRADGRRLAPILVELLADPAPAVRQQALEALKQLAGRDVGVGTGAEAGSRWRAWAESLGSVGK